MVLLQDVGRPCADLLRDVAAQRDDLLDRELDTLGFDHTVLSARLLDHGGLPRSLVELVAGCGDKQPTLAMPIEQQLQTAKTLFLSELFARLLADQQVGAFGRLFRFGHDHCELEIAQLGPLVELLEEKVIQLADVLALQLDDGEDYSSIMEKAREQTEDVRSELELSVSSRCDESLSSAVTVPPPLPCQQSQPADARLAEPGARRDRPLRRRRPESRVEPGTPVARYARNRTTGESGQRFRPTFRRPLRRDPAGL